MKRILFVDDEPKVLEALRRMLRSLRREWEMVFERGGPEAVRRLDAEPFDVVVTDMRMPGMDGSQLLHEVIRRRPEAVRIILSGQCDRRTVMKTVGPAHQFLTKPCDSELLKSTIARACAARDRLPDDRIKQVVARVQSLPAQTSSLAALSAALDSPTAGREALGEVVAADVAMAAKVLQLVNSGFFGSPRRISDPRHAAELLGVETLRALVESTDAFPAYSASRWQQFPLEQLNLHAREVARAAAAIARAETGEGRIAADASLAGLLHVVGVLILAGEIQGQNPRERLCHARDEVEGRFLCTRGDVAAYLLELWGLPEEVVTAVAYHSGPGQSGERAFSALTAVHVASSIMACEVVEPLGIPVPLDREYLDAIGCGDRLGAWREACLAAVFEGAAP